MYPLHSAQLRLAVFRLAANRAVDAAMRRLHDMPNMAEQIPRLVRSVDERLDHEPRRSEDYDGFVALFRAEAARRFHARMKTDQSNCRWCGLTQREALEELEAEDD